MLKPKVTNRPSIELSPCKPKVKQSYNWTSYSANDAGYYCDFPKLHYDLINIFLKSVPAGVDCINKVLHSFLVTN